MGRLQRRRSAEAPRPRRQQRTGSHGELLLGQADGRLAGEIQARQPEMGLPPGVFEIGIEVFDPTVRGTGIGRRALGLFLVHLFVEEHAHRVQLTTDVDNAAMRRVAERPSSKGPCAASCPPRTAPVTT